MPRIDTTVVLLKDDIERLRKGDILYIDIGGEKPLPLVYERGKPTNKETSPENKLPCVIQGCSKLSANNLGLRFHLQRAHAKDPAAKKWLENQKKGVN